MMTTSVHHSATRRPVWEYIAPVMSIHQMIKADAKTRIFGDHRPTAQTATPIMTCPIVS